MTPATEPTPSRATGAWQFSSFAEVTQALNDARLVFPGQAHTDPAAHRAVRAAMAQALAPARLAALRGDFTAHAVQWLDAMPDGEPVDLVRAFAEPWSLALAVQVTGVPQGLATECDGLARRLFQAAAVATDGAPNADSGAAAAQLARLLADAATDAATGAAAGQGGIADVQTFVALSQSLPALLSGAWWVLLRHPAALAALLAHPHAVERAVGELLRLGSPAQAVFREVAAPTEIGGVSMRPGDRVALMLAAANRDPARFTDPDTLDLARDTTGQLSLGTGLHRCAGAALVRLALVTATEALLARSAALALVDQAESALVWRGGFALRAPASLPVQRVSSHRPDPARA